MKFRYRNENELLQLTDEEHVEYIVRARNAGEREAMTAAVGIFAWRREKMVMGLIGLKNVPGKDREQVFMEVIHGTLKAGFDGVSVGQIVNLVKTITQRKTADYFQKNRHELRSDPLPESDGESGPELGQTDGSIEGIEIRQIVESVLETRSPEHRKVIELRLQKSPSKEIAKMMEVPMSPANIDKIFSRFNEDLKKAFDDAEVE